MIKYLAIDPGDTTGWAHFDENGKLVAYGQVKEAEFNKWLLKELTDNELTAVITEDYINHGWQQQKRWSKNKTSKKIGGIEALCSAYSVPVHLQRNTCKPIGYKWAGLSAPSNHSISHQFDAVAHGTYWLTQNGILAMGANLRRENGQV